MSTHLIMHVYMIKYVSTYMYMYLYVCILYVCIYIYIYIGLYEIGLDHRTIVSTFVSGWSAVRPPHSPRIPGASLASSVAGAGGAGGVAVAAGALGQKGPGESTSQRTARRLGHPTAELYSSWILMNMNDVKWIEMIWMWSFKWDLEQVRTLQQFHRRHARMGLGGAGRMHTTGVLWNI